MSSSNVDFELLGPVLTRVEFFFCSLSDPEYWFVNPFSVIGITIAVCGLMFVGFSIEACIQLKQNLSRVQDPEIDDITNLHHIKHWIEPGMHLIFWFRKLITSTVYLSGYSNSGLETTSSI